MNFGTNGCMYNCGDSCTGECIEPIKPMNNEQQTEKGSINITQPRSFKIDFTKVKSLDDVIAILNGMDLTVFQYDETIPEKFKTLFDKGLLIQVTNDTNQKETL
jgi:hypothetical protein